MLDPGGAVTPRGESGSARVLIMHDMIRPRPMLAGDIKAVVRVVACTGETHEFAPGDVLHMNV